jgi:hypothetical protein
VLKVNNWKLRGIVNGIDYKEWHPSTDEYLVVRLGCLRRPRTEGQRRQNDSACLPIQPGQRGSQHLRGSSATPTARLPASQTHSRSTSAKLPAPRLRADPQGDGFQRYDVDTILEGKRACKLALQVRARREAGPLPLHRHNRRDGRRMRGSHLRAAPPARLRAPSALRRPLAGCAAVCPRVPPSGACRLPALLRVSECAAELGLDWCIAQFKSKKQIICPYH